MYCRAVTLAGVDEQSGGHLCNRHLCSSATQPLTRMDALADA